MFLYRYNVRTVTRVIRFIKRKNVALTQFFRQIFIKFRGLIPWLGRRISMFVYLYCILLVGIL